jgi:hypothetical protein
VAAAFACVLAATQANAQTEDVAWKAAVGVTVSGNDLTKTGAAGWGNAAASSVQSLDSTGFVEFSASGTVALGLSKGDTGLSYPDIDFAIYLSNSTVYVYENGTSKGSTEGSRLPTSFGWKPRTGSCATGRTAPSSTPASSPPAFPSSSTLR